MAKKQGRKRRGPWLRKSDNCYYTSIDRKPVLLGSADLPWAEIERAYNELLAQHHSGAKADRSVWTVAALIDEFLDFCQRRKAARTYEWYQKYLVEFHAEVGDKMGAVDLRPSRVTAWVESRFGNCSDSTKFGAIRCVVRVYNWAVAEGHLDRSPLKGIEKPTPTSRETFITPAQFEELLSRVYPARISRP
ncbi:MAG: hypothetical protein KF847_18305 [Pirellulales bacterium]|nr:hypothetical protein [Pirellulales bacterium]